MVDGEDDLGQSHDDSRSIISHTRYKGKRLLGGLLFPYKPFSARFEYKVPTLGTPYLS